MQVALGIEPTRDNILQRVPEEMIMEHYLGVPVTERGLFRSPLRIDRHPTCSYFKTCGGTLLFKDFGADFVGDCFGVVMKKYGVGFHEACAIVANDFGITPDEGIERHERMMEYTRRKFHRKAPCVVQAEVKEYTAAELAWWASFGIDRETLELFNVHSCKNVFLNGSFFTSSSRRSFIFGYYYGRKNGCERWKIYFPFKRDYRFLSNWTAGMVQGARQLPRSGGLCVVTKSMKDVMCLHSFGIAAVAPNSETLFLTDMQLGVLKRRFGDVAVFYDNDYAGITNMAKIRRATGLPCVFIPRTLGAKDISDYYRANGRDKTALLIQEGIGWLRKRSSSPAAAPGTG